MTVLAGITIWTAAMITIAALADNRNGARAGLVIALSLVPMPAFVSGSPFAQCLMAFLVLVCLARAVDFVFGRSPAGFARRLLYVFAMFAFADTLVALPRDRCFDWRSGAKMLIALVAIGAVIALWSTAAVFPFWVRYLVRSFLAGVVFVAMAEIMTASVRIVTGIMGVALPPVHDSPQLSLSVSEFWNKRWNLTTGKWLHEYCFKPFARQGVTFALFVTFAASAAMHAYLLIAIDTSAALSWAAFFLAQPLAIVIERKIQIRRLPRPARRLWTIVMFMLLLPLMVHPLLPLFNTSL